VLVRAAGPILVVYGAETPASSRAETKAPAGLPGIRAAFGCPAASLP
jgi:hypothetical protein